MQRRTGDRGPTLSELEFAKLGGTQYPMPSLLICARIAEDVYHDSPTTVHGYEPVVVPQQEIYCAGHEFAGGAYAGTDAVGIVAFRGSRELEDWKANFEILRRKMPERQVGSAPL